MPHPVDYYIYIKTDEKHLRFVVGLVDNIVRVLEEQKNQARHSKTSRSANPQLPRWKLVYYEHGHNLYSATLRQKKLQQLPRSKRAALIERHNPSWHDLGHNWLREG
jgi:predicted GIY-YIG superfamily endonuclease